MRTLPQPHLHVGYQPLQNPGPQQGGSQPASLPQGGLIPPGASQGGYIPPGYTPSKDGGAASPQKGYYPQQGFVPPPQYTAGAQQQVNKTY